ncbi:MAG: SpoIID/LytB domain-containing protein [Eubacteriales bacterium]
MSNLKKKKKLNWTRLLCLILAILMVGGMAILGIQLIISGFAADVSYDTTDYTFSSETDGDTYIAVGLMYGTSVTVGFEIKAPYGFVVGRTEITDKVRAFSPLYYLDTTIASATLDSNLYKKSMTYYLTDDPSDTVIGGYHIQLSYNGEYGFSYEFLVADVENILGSDSLYPIPAYVDGNMKIRLGNYATEADALAALEAYSALFSEYTLEIAAPSRTAVSIVNPNTDRILFEYDSPDMTDSIGFMAYQGDEFTSYIQTPASNLYDGVMSFVPQYTDTASGVKLINLLELEKYVQGVLPYEISNSWSTEVLRTFAITIRSYALASYCKRYSSYGFDLTNTANDQVYRGMNRVNDAVVDAVESTKGLVTVYDGKICSAYYSSSVGGSTVGSEYVWGSERGYLTSVSTPWERYADYNNGLWHTEVSPTELCTTLRSKGYTELSGAIESIAVTTVDDNPDYVYSLTFTDTSGNSVTIRRCDTVRTLLSSYIKSANFTVAQNSLDFSYNKVIDIEVVGATKPTDPSNPSSNPDGSVKGYITDGQVLISNAGIITESGEIMISEYPVSYILTSTGRKVIMNSNVLTGVPYDETTPIGYESTDSSEDYSGESTSEPADEPVTTEPVITTTDLGNNSYKITSEFPNVTVITTLETVTETLNASSSGNFIFAGKGWGHGVGISQYGAKDLSDAGATAEQILSIYFSGISIVDRSSLK